VRSDITEGKEGLPFDLRVLVVDADTCAPIKDAAVDVWHCDALGEYSGVEGDSGTFLRGVQMTDAGGAAQFRTVFPGWYRGRAVHIHLKVLLGGSETLTGQLFFDDATLDAVYGREPYVARGESDTPNEADGIFAQSEGATIVAVDVGESSCSGSVTLGVRRV
jgi:protocatechuate 3,4-dioxygenase beta subunit